MIATLAWPAWLDHDKVVALLRVIVLLGVGLPLLNLLARLAARLFRGRITEQASMLVSKLILYSGTAIIGLIVLRELGFKMNALLGAAGIVGMAVGFASQTSLSNLISGLFLIWEAPCQVGDVVTSGEITGVVQSIDLLSMKLRTFDNKFVRIPNETLIKSQLTNITRFPIRRLDINIGVAYKEDVAKVLEVLADVADKNPFCLDEPAPILLFKGFGDSALEFLFGVWFAKKDFLDLRNSILADVKKRFDEEGIEIPFPHRTLYAGAATAPFPVRVVEPDGQPVTGDT